MWLSYDEVANLGKTPRWVRMQASSGAIKSRGTGRRGRNGKEIREISLESLPDEMKLEWIRQNKPESDLNENDSSLTTDSIVSERRLAEALMQYEPHIRDAMRDEALRLQSIVNRYKMISPRRQKNARGKHEFVKEVWDLCEKAKCTNVFVLLHEPHRAEAPSPHTLDNWMRCTEEEGLSAFLRKPAERRKQNDKRKAVISADAIEWTNKNWRNFPCVGHFYKAICKTGKEKNWKIPSESWFRRKYDDVPKIVETVVFGNDYEYQSKYAPFVQRHVEDLEALQVVCGDHSIRDATVAITDTGKLARPWLTLWLCLRTYLIWGWYLDLIPSSKTIALAYANGVKTFGAQPLSNPEIGFHSYWHTDWGKDYRAKTFDGQTLIYKQAAKIDGGLETIFTERRVGFLPEMGLKHLLTRTYNGKEKPVERVHKDISEWEKNTFLRDGYCGRDAKHRPEAWTEAYKKHQKLQKKFAKDIPRLLEETPFFTFEEYREAIAGWIHEHNTTVHKRTVMGGRKIVPLDELNRLYTRVDISEEALALLLMKTEKRKVGKNGINLFRSNWWFLHPELSEHKGQEIEVRYSDDDYNRVWAICPATPEKPQRIVEATLVTPSSILNPNKQTMKMIAEQKNHEKKVIREFNLLNQSVIRGENIEDRVAALLRPEELEVEEVEIKKVASGGGGSIHQLTRMDAPKIRAHQSKVSTEQVESAEIIDIFRKPERGKIKEEWED